MVDLHLQIGLFSNLVLGLAIATLAVLATRSRALGGGRLLAVLAVVGGLAFGLAALLLVTTGNELFGILFIGSVPLGLWLAASGVLLARRA